MKLKLLAIIMIISTLAFLCACNSNQNNDQETNMENKVDVVNEEIYESNEETLPGTGLKRVSFEEIAKHNTPQDCWIIYQDMVYDITDFLPRHPDEGAKIEEYCGNIEGLDMTLINAHSSSKDSTLEKEGILLGTL
jgi:hypothetical protein